MSRLRLMILTLGAVALVAVAGWFVHERDAAAKDADTKGPARLTMRTGNVVKFKLGAELAESYGIQAEAAKSTVWQPRILVDGRVIANPHATFDVRAPFAGFLQPDAAIFRIGAQVTARQPFGMFEARVSPLEKLDLRAKSVESEARCKGAEEVLRIRQERSDRLQILIASGSVSRGEIDNAAIQLSEARMQKDIALTQWEIWKQALAAAGKKSIIVPLQSPISGEIAEISAQPGTHVEAGQLLVRIVDFRRILQRLDFSLANAAASPPGEVEVEKPSMSVLESSPRWRALLRGPAPAIEVGLHKASYLYEFVPANNGPSPAWRPGLYIQATLPDPARAAQPAVAVPAAAVLVHQGRSLVYVQLSPGRYERRVVDIIGREGDRLYVSSGVRGQELVVSKHAQVLLSEEFRSDVDDD
jgi:hypothetical protein